MASSLLAMKKELECAICFKVMKDPKIVGSCHHVFCKECLRKYISQGTSDTFPCPKCGVEHAVPKDGVKGLKDDFRTASFVEILLKAEPGHLTNPKHMCSECGEKDDTKNGRKMAEFLCDTCDLDLCSGCRHDHSNALGTVDHIVFDLCTTHWRKMKHFCRSCSIVMCGLCKKSEHSEGTHETVLYKGSFEEDISKIVDNAGKTLARAQLKHDAAVEGERVMKKEVKSRKTSLADSANAIVKSSNSEITDLQTKIKEMQAQVLKLEKRVDRVIARKKLFDKKEKETADDYCKSVATFSEVLYDLMFELRRQSAQLQQLKSTNCLGSSHNASVIDCKREMRRITVNIEDTLRATPKQRKPDPMPVLHEKSTEFTQAEQFKEWYFKTNNIERIFSIEILPNDFGVAVLGGTSPDRTSFASKIFFSSSLQSKDIKIISDGVTPGLDLTVASNGDLILLRKMQPHIKFYRYGDHYLKADDLHVSSLGNPKSVTYDEKRKLFFIARVKPNSGPKSEVLQINGSNGSILRRIDCGDSGRLACDPVQQRVFKCYRGIESYNETTLNYSNSWDVPNVEIFDVNWSNTDERLYAAGRRPSYEIVLYQIGPDKTVRPIGPLLDGKGQQVVCGQPCNPRSAVCGDLLLVGVGGRVIFYRLM